uniref:Uncharacterized protein n=1 Tax=Tanacetum cinerariifolium TaxID=118510 RepID=A0A6L2LE48_TANCI|nr:hypothetical protein [Tanacetum cinerariifolium]
MMVMPNYSILLSGDVSTWGTRSLKSRVDGVGRKIAINLRLLASRLVNRVYWSHQGREGPSEWQLWLYPDLSVWVGRGVKEKDFHRIKKNTSSGIGVSTDSEDTMNDDTPVGVSSIVQEGVTASVVDMTVETKMQNSLDHITIPDCFPLVMPLERMWHTLLLLTMLGILENNSLILKKWHPNENILKEDVSIVLVWVKLHGVPVMAFSEDSLSVIATRLGTFLMLDSYTSDMCMQSWGRSSYARVMIKLRADVELKDNIVVAMPKITKESYYTCNVRVEYEWKPPRGTTNLVNNGATSSGSFMNIDNDGEFASNTPISEKIDQIERQICEGKLRLLDNDGNPLVPTGIAESDSEVEVVFNETANLRISTSDNDDYDPYDDDMYENHDLSEHLQSICDDLDIMVHGRKKK